MPLYDIKCERSGKIFERVIPLAKFEEEIFCSCGSVARRVISTPMFAVDQTDYCCPITGQHIYSRRAHEENLKRHDCRVLETGEKEAAERYRKAADASLDRKLDATIEKEIEALPSAKKERLYNELTHCDLAVERR
jgi:hypothetical protein